MTKTSILSIANCTADNLNILSLFRRILSGIRCNPVQALFLEDSMKKCSKCKEWMPATLEYFYSNKSKKDNLCDECKKCRQKYLKSDRFKEIQRKSDTQRRATPHRKHYQKKYDAVYKRSDKGKETTKKSHIKYNKTEKGIVARRRTAKNYTLKFPHKKKAVNDLNHAVDRKEVIRPSYCMVLGCHNTENIQGHHFSYNFPLDVLWVCQSCHTKIHSKIMD